MSGTSVVFCGLVRNPDVFKLALAQAVALRAEGKIQRLILSTWRGEVDKMPYGAAFFKAFDIQVIETDFPGLLEVSGNVFQQMLVMDRALDEIDEDDLVLRTRTDVIFLDQAALADILSQDLGLGPQYVDEGEMPIFSERIWAPFFHPAFPFLVGDNLFLGRARDLRKLNNYDLHTEAYQIGSRRHEIDPTHNSGAGPEIRRFLMPFAQRFPILREYQFVWPKHCIGTSLLTEVMAYNFDSSLYREYMALFFALIVRYFRIGGVPSAAGKVLLAGGAVGEPLINRMTLVQNDLRSPRFVDRLCIPPVGTRSFHPSYGSAWLDGLFADPAGDPEAEDGVIRPLARAASVKSDAARRAAFKLYRDGLWAIADRP